MAERMGLTGYTMAHSNVPGQRPEPVVPREGFPATLLGNINQRMTPVTPPEMAPSSLTPGSSWLGNLLQTTPRAPVPPESFPSTLLEGGMQRHLSRTSLPIIPREGFPSSLLGNINQRLRPRTPPEGAPRTAYRKTAAVPVSAMVDRGSNLAGLGFLPEGWLTTAIGDEVVRIDKSRLVALLVGYLTYKGMPIPQAFLASMAAPWLIRKVIGPDIQPGTNLIDGLEAVLVGLVATGQLGQVSRYI